MNPFQRAYDWFKNLTAPQWLRQIIKTLNDLLISLALQIGKNAINKIKAKIIEVADNPKLTNEDKFKEVFDFTIELSPQLSERYINLLIESLVNQLKEDSVI